MKPLNADLFNKIKEFLDKFRLCIEELTLR